MEPSSSIFPEDVSQGLAQLPVQKLVALLEAAARRDPLVWDMVVSAVQDAGGSTNGAGSALPPSTSGLLVPTTSGLLVPTTSGLMPPTSSGLMPSLEQQLLQMQLAADGGDGSAAALGFGADASSGGGSGQLPSLSSALSLSALGLNPGGSTSGAGSAGGSGGDRGLNFSSDEFRMFCHKAVPCSISYNHSWSACPYAHPGEKTRRRDPRRFKYVAVACPYHKAGACMLGEACPYAHGVFEVNLHPAKYRTEVCRDGSECTRAVCFFAHSARELRQPLLDFSPSPEEFAATEGVRVQRVKAALPASHVLQGTIDTALQEALPQLRLHNNHNGGGANGGTRGAMEALASGQAMLLASNNSVPQ